MSQHIRIGAAVALAVVLCGCATRGEPEFGSSVRHMVQGQKFDPSAPTDEVGGVDGHKAAKAIEGYRADKKAAGKSAPVIPVAMPTSQ
jgi:hypothetical protein